MFAAVATFRKIESPQMIGVEPLYAGSGSLQSMFLASTLLHHVDASGRPSAGRLVRAG